MLRWTHPSPNANGHLDRFSRFYTSNHGVSLYFTTGPSKLPIPIEGSGPPSNTMVPWATQVVNPNGISIGSPVFVEERMKVLGSIEWRAFSSGCREVVRLQVHIGWRMERFDKHQDTNEVRDSVEGPRAEPYTIQP